MREFMLATLILEMRNQEGRGSCLKRNTYIVYMLPKFHPEFQPNRKSMVTGKTVHKRPIVNTASLLFKPTCILLLIVSLSRERERVYTSKTKKIKHKNESMICLYTVSLKYYDGLQLQFYTALL